jgi:hypothetical protein
MTDRVGLDVYGRAIGLTLGVGMLAGAVTGAVVALLMTAGGGAYGSAVELVAVATMYGAGVGGLAGWVVGLPVVLAVALVRPYVVCWRGLGAVVAGGYVVVASGALVGWQSAVLVPSLAVGLLAGCCACWGLGRVFGPPSGARHGDRGATLSR